MSQQIEPNGRASQQQTGYDDGYQGSYHDPFATSYAGGQKLSTQAPAAQRATSGQRLCIAIVSVAVLAGLAISLFSSTNLITAGIVAMLIGLAVVFVVALALVAINWIFNRR